MAAVGEVGNLNQLNHLDLKLGSAMLQKYRQDSVLRERSKNRSRVLKKQLEMIINARTSGSSTPNEVVFIIRELPFMFGDSQGQSTRSSRNAEQSRLPPYARDNVPEASEGAGKSFDLR